jgi:methionyl-tRNA formyltransferase
LARVAVFGSFMGGYHVLSELLFGDLADRVEIVGVATDDSTQPFTNAKVRLWKYPHTPDDETLVPRFALSKKLPVFTGRVKSAEFYELMVNDWHPELCLMATFGQKIPNHLFTLPRLGFYNFHHSSPDSWPSYPGPDPIAAMVRDGRKDLVLTMHKVSDVIDDGEFVARSHPVAIPPGINAIEMHRITWPQMHGFIRRAVTDILDADESLSGASQTWTMHEEPAEYLAA